MKKLLSLCIIALMILASLPTNSLAAGDIAIISPAGSVTTELNSFEVTCDGAEKIIFKLDGSVLGQTNGETSLSVPEGSLSVGNHTLDVIAVFADGSAQKCTKSFNVSAVIEKFSYSDAGSLSGFTLIRPTKAELIDGVGVTGLQDDAAKTFQANINEAFTSSQPYIENSDSKYSFVSGGRKKFSADINLNTVNDHITLVGMDGFAANGNLIRNATWYNTGSSYVPSDGWMHLEMESDHYNNTLICKADGKVIYNGAIVYKGSGNARISLYQREARTESNRAGITVDNLCYSQEFEYGLTSFEYSDSGEVWSDASVMIPASCQKIRISASEPYNPATLTTDNITLLNGGKSVTLSDISYDSTNNYITLTLSDSLIKGSSVVLNLSENIQLANTSSAAGVALEAHSVTEASDLEPSLITYKKGETNLLTSSQLKTGDIIKAELTLNNKTNEDKKIAAFVCVYQNRKMRAIGSVEKYVPSSGEIPVQITLPALSALDAEGEISLKLTICDGLDTTRPYMEFFKLD